MSCTSLAQWDTAAFNRSIQYDSEEKYLNDHIDTFGPDLPVNEAWERFRTAGLREPDRTFGGGISPDRLLNVLSAGYSNEEIENMYSMVSEVAAASGPNITRKGILIARPNPGSRLTRKRLLEGGFEIKDDIDMLNAAPIYSHVDLAKLALNMYYEKDAGKKARTISNIAHYFHHYFNSKYKAIQSSSFTSNDLRNNLAKLSSEYRQVLLTLGIDPSDPITIVGEKLSVQKVDNSYRQLRRLAAFVGDVLGVDIEIDHVFAVRKFALEDIIGGKDSYMNMQDSVKRMVMNNLNSRKNFTLLIKALNSSKGNKRFKIANNQLTNLFKTIFGQHIYDMRRSNDPDLVRSVDMFKEYISKQQGVANLQKIMIDRGINPTLTKDFTDSLKAAIIEAYKKRSL